jgi:hypothetical protein
MHTEYWRRRSGKNNWNVLMVAEKGKDHFEVALKIKPEPWYKNTKLSSVDTLKNRILTSHTYPPNWLAKMRLAIDGVCDLCEKEMGIQHILYTCMKFTRRRQTCDCLD